METLRLLVKEWLVPGSLLFFVACVLAGVLLLFGSARAAFWGRLWLSGLVGLYLLLSLQGTSDLLVWGLSRHYEPLRTRDSARGARYIVVLSNGARRIELQQGGVHVLSTASAYSTLEALRIYHLLGNAKILASGGPANAGERAEGRALAATLRGLGVPSDDLFVEDASWTTYWQGANVAKWLKGRGESACVLVTAPEHMRRAEGVLKAKGIRTVPSPSGVDYGGPPAWRPSSYALEGSRNALYEYLAVLFYRAQGWM